MSRGEEKSWKGGELERKKEKGRRGGEEERRRGGEEERRRGGEEERRGGEKKRIGEE